MVHINNVQDFETYVLNTNKPALVDFYSDTCTPCHMLSPTIDKLARQYQEKAIIAKINVAHIPELT